MFVAVEGPDFAGKTTLCKALAEAWPAAFNRKPEDLVTAREPGGTPFGERLRSLLFEERRGAATELHLFSAARCELVSKVIRPALEAKKDVLLDRYWLSTVAYQGVQLWPTLQAIPTVESLAHMMKWPQAFTVVVISPPEVIMRRMKARAEETANPFDPNSETEVIKQIKTYQQCLAYLRLKSDMGVLRVSGEDEALPITVELIIKQLTQRFSQ